MEFLNYLRKAVHDSAENPEEIKKLGVISHIFKESKERHWGEAFILNDETNEISLYVIGREHVFKCKRVIKVGGEANGN